MRPVADVQRRRGRADDKALEAPSDPENDPAVVNTARPAKRIPERQDRFVDVCRVAADEALGLLPAAPISLAAASAAGGDRGEKTRSRPGWISG